jgi:hypothetical protein
VKTVYVSVLISAFTLFTACGDRTTAQVGEHAGTVVEAMDAAGYTYALIDTGTEKIWAAGPQCAVSPGDAVPVPHGMVMENFTSKTLGRTFEKIHFVQSITGSKQPQDVCSFKQKPAQDGCSRTEAPAAQGSQPPPRLKRLPVLKSLKADTLLPTSTPKKILSPAKRSPCAAQW